MSGLTASITKVRCLDLKLEISSSFGWAEDTAYEIYANCLKAILMLFAHYLLRTRIHTFWVGVVEGRRRRLQIANSIQKFNILKSNCRIIDIYIAG